VGLIHEYGKAGPANTRCLHITPHHTTNLKFINGHFVDELRKFILRFNISIHFIPKFPLEKLKIPFCFTTCLRNTVVLFWCTCTVFASFRINDAGTVFGCVGGNNNSVYQIYRAILPLYRVPCANCVAAYNETCCLKNLLTLKCSVVWNGRISEGSFGRDMTFLLRILFNGLRFIEFPALRT
jgi:hypothetical protein